MSASDQKQSQGSSSKDTGAIAGSGSTVLSFDSNSKSTRAVDGKPLLVRSVKVGDKWGPEVDFWNAVTKSSASKLEQILSASIGDQSYAMHEFISQIEYQGFDREFYIKHALTKMSISVFSRFAIIGALRGSNFTKISETCEQMPGDLTAAFGSLSFVKTPKKRTDLTILRGTASIPHWCVYWLRMSNTPKKIPSSDCPAALQFPGAASLPMSSSVRKQHLKFCYDFSMLLPGGKFNANIYMTAMRNQIPVSAIHAQVVELLQVASNSESYMLTQDDLEPYSNAKALVKR